MTAGLILAAGAGTRFGEIPKQLAPLHGRPLLQWAVDAQCAVPAELLAPIVVVLGAHAEQVAAGVDFRRSEPVICAQWETGQSASLRCGLRALADAQTILVTLGDAPLITPEVIARFIAEPPGTRAGYGGRPGHPVVLGAAQIAALRDNAGDRGAREVLRGAPMLEVGHLCSGRDVDTPADLEEVRDDARRTLRASRGDA